MKDEATKNFEKKLRKFFRRKQWKNFWLGFKGNKYQLADKFPLDAYSELANELTGEELYKFKSSLEGFEDVPEDIAVTIIPTNYWFDRCCEDLSLFDSFSDGQLEKVLNDRSNNISKLFFFADGQSLKRQFKIMYLLSEGQLENWIFYLRDEEFSKFNSSSPDFFTYLSQESGKRTDEIFQKLASLSNCSVAKLMQNLKAGPARRILQKIIQADEDVFVVVQKIEKDKLYDVVMNKLDLLQNADVDRTEEWYSWLYSNLPAEDAREFLAYLADEKWDELVLFNKEICVEIFDTLSDDETATEFIKEIFMQKGSEEFENFYAALSFDGKEDMFELLSKDNYGREIIAFLLETKKEEDLSLLEKLVKEKYVTQK